MALQQILPVTITLLGDGVSTVFTYSLTKLPLFATQGSNRVNLGVLPTAATYDAVNSSVPGSVSIDTYGNLNIVLSSPLTSGATADVTIDLLFASGNLSQSTPNTLSFSGTAAPVVANQYSPVAIYPVPSGMTAIPVTFRSLSSTAGFAAALIATRLLATWNMGTKSFTAGDVIQQPRFLFSLFSHVTTATSNAATTLTLTYTNESGVTGRIATATIPASSPVGARAQFILAAGDVGVLAVTGISGTGNATGVLSIFGATTISYHVNAIAGQLYETSFAIEQVYEAGDKLQLEIFAATTTATHREVSCTFKVQ